MLRKFICVVTHHYSDNHRVEREHIIYMPEKEYDNSGARWKNHSWVENKLEAKLGERYVSGVGSRYFIRRIYQKRL